MKNVIVINFQGHRKYPFDKMETEMKAQIENSLAVGWSPEDMIVITNFQYEFMGVKAINVDLNNFCLTGSKMFGTKILFDKGMVEGPIWVHDLDVWQTAPFECPEFEDLGICTYSNPKFNGGSLFYKPEAKDIVDAVVDSLTVNQEGREEPTINNILKSDKFKKRVTVLNNTYNVGCSGYQPRYERSEKPIKAVHFHPTNRIAWDTMTRQRNYLTMGDAPAPVNKRLHKIFMKYFGDKIKTFTYEGERGYDGNYEPVSELPE